MTTLSQISQKRKVLIVDDEQDIREILAMYVETHFNFEVLIAQNGTEAIEVIKKNTDLACVLCDYNMPNGNGGMVYTFIRKNFPQIPYILVSTSNASDYPEFSDNEVFGSAQKPYFLASLKTLLEKLPSQKPNTFDNEYCSVGYAILQFLKTAPCDIYLKLSENHYVKTINSGTEILLEDLDKLKNKGAPFLYLLKKDAIHVLNRLDQSFFDIQAGRAVTAEDFFEKNTTTIQLIQNLKEHFKWSEQLVLSTKKAIKNVLENAKKSSAASVFLAKLKQDSDSLLVQHASIQSIITLDLLKILNFKDDSIFENMVCASIFKDMALDQSEQKNYFIFKKNTLDKKSKNLPDVKKFMEHPFLGSILIRDLGEYFEKARILILEHHETHNGMGFPFQFDYTKVLLSSAVFIISNELADFLLDPSEKIKTPAKFYEQLLEKNLTGEFEKVLQAISVLYVL